MHLFAFIYGLFEGEFNASDHKELTERVATNVESKDSGANPISSVPDNVVQTDSGVHPTPYPMGIGGSFPGVERPGREADHSPGTSTEVKKMWIYTSTIPHVMIN
jgi:hypothetical protein